MKTATTNLTLKVDSVNPTAGIRVNGAIPGAVINVDQLAFADFSAADSYDLIYDETVPQGIVKSVDWAFGDGFYANSSVTTRHAYLDPGFYNLTVQITDASGRVTIAPFLVKVRDTREPTVVVNITRVADGSVITASAVVGDPLLFDGSSSTDPGGIVSYTWNFGDGKNATGVRAQHTYASQRTITGSLTCVDQAGNVGVRNFTLTILPRPGPDLHLTDMTFNPSVFTEGSGGTVQISVINVGSGVANNITTGFYLMQSGGNQLLVRIDGVTVNGVVADHLEIGQGGTVTASISFPTQGSYTILANSTADNEQNPGDNSHTATLQVQESAWKYAGIYFGIIFLFVVVALLLFMRRGATTKKKGKKGKKR
jgi:PKD repeat protein